ncbi:hypothetical protein HAX54_025445, partial [Datura stramonium]|nr:hypothetical protein [Datura stramonium]
VEPIIMPDLNVTPTMEGISSLVSHFGEPKKQVLIPKTPVEEDYNNKLSNTSNGTVHLRSMVLESKSKQTIEENKDTEEEQCVDSWTNLFKNNRDASNGMSLSYIPPIFVDGEIVIQLDEQRCV